MYISQVIIEQIVFHIKIENKTQAKREKKQIMETKP